MKLFTGMPRRPMLRGLIAAAALMLHQGLAPAQAQDEDLKIGIFVPLTGALAPLGKDMLNGYELAAKEVGSVRDMPVKLVVEDTQANAAAGLRKAQKLVLQDQVSALVGGASSSVVLGIAAQGRRLDVPIITTNSQAVQTTGEQCSHYLFRTNPNDAMQARANAELLKIKPELRGKKWFVVFHDFVWGQSNKAEFEKIEGIEVIGEAGRPMGTADWSSAISQIQASEADAIYLALAVGDDMPAFIRQARNFGLDQFMLPPLGMPDSMLQALGKDAEGLVAGALFGTWMSEEDSEKMAEFVEAYHTEYGIVPGPQAIQAYAGMKLTLAALEQAESLETDAVIEAMENARVNTVIGDLSIRAGDHQGTSPVYVVEAVTLKEPKYGAKVGWKPIQTLPWDAVKVPLEETGCKGL